VYAPEDDPEMKVERYERSFEQNEYLGLNDMKTVNYTNDDAWLVDLPVVICIIIYFCKFHSLLLSKYIREVYSLKEFSCNFIVARMAYISFVMSFHLICGCTGLHKFNIC